MALNCIEVDVVAMAKKLGELDFQQTANAHKQNIKQIGTLPIKLKYTGRIIFSFYNSLWFISYLCQS